MIEDKQGSLVDTVTGDAVDPWCEEIAYDVQTRGYARTPFMRRTALMYTVVLQRLLRIIRFNGDHSAESRELFGKVVTEYLHTLAKELGLRDYSVGTLPPLLSCKNFVLCVTSEGITISRPQIEVECVSWEDAADVSLLREKLSTRDKVSEQRV